MWRHTYHHIEAVDFGPIFDGHVFACHVSIPRASKRMSTTASKGLVPSLMIDVQLQTQHQRRPI